DLIEEVIRVLGYDILGDGAPHGTLTPRVKSEAQRSADALRDRVVGLGYRESINFSFVDERWERELAGNADPIRVLNPIASSLSVMRSSLLGSLIGALRFNLARKATRVRLFEAGRVFRRDGSVADGPLEVAGVDQPMRLAGLAYGAAEPLQWGAKERPTDFYDVKGDIEALLAPRIARFVPATHPALHPGRCARIELDGNSAGFIGELHPRWRQAYELPSAPLLFELDLDAVSRLEVPAFQPLPRQQSAWRDLALVAGDDVSHEALLKTIMTVAGGPVRSARLFDVYKPSAPVADISAGERSLAVRLEIHDDEVTLTDERIDSVVDGVLAALQRDLGLRLRGRQGTTT
ncbi:MAG: phenylalanine--tRNA ligase subunit beta, partial [Pseudomonadota bacterium]|nr:phenylalanine--tRNA ligase subunit beta [Pseudomonadota bacterium]